MTIPITETQAEAMFKAFTKDPRITRFSSFNLFVAGITFAEEWHKAEVAVVQSVQPAEDNMEIVGYQYQWTNPADYQNIAEEEIEWELVVPARGQTEQGRLDDILGYRYLGKPVYRVRTLYTPAQPKETK